MISHYSWSIYIDLNTATLSRTLNEYFLLMHKCWKLLSSARLKCLYLDEGRCYQIFKFCIKYLLYLFTAMELCMKPHGLSLGCNCEWRGFLSWCKISKEIILQSLCHNRERFCRLIFLLLFLNPPQTEYRIRVESFFFIFRRLSAFLSTVIFAPFILVCLKMRA